MSGYMRGLLNLHDDPEEELAKQKLFKEEIPDLIKECNNILEDNGTKEILLEMKNGLLNALYEMVDLAKRTNASSIKLIIGGYSSDLIKQILQNILKENPSPEISDMINKLQIVNKAFYKIGIGEHFIETVPKETLIVFLEEQVSTGTKARRILNDLGDNGYQAKFITLSSVVDITKSNSEIEANEQDMKKLARQGNTGTESLPDEEQRKNVIICSPNYKLYELLKKLGVLVSYYFSIYAEDKDRGHRFFYSDELRIKREKDQLVFVEEKDLTDDVRKMFDRIPGLVRKLIEMLE